VAIWIGLSLGAASQEPPRVLFVLPAVGNLYLPHLLISQELFPVVDTLEDSGVVVEFTGPEPAVYSLPLNEAGDRRREIRVEAGADEIDLDQYEIVVTAGGHAHQYLTVIVEPMLSLFREAYERGITLAGLSHGVLGLSETGLFAGRTIARCPPAIGIVYCHNTIPAFEKSGVTFSDDQCLVVSEGENREPTLITATYRCVHSFARALLADLGVE
jgi:putative intracellular protease/amidase